MKRIQSIFENREKLVDLAQSRGVSYMAVFGSVVRGDDDQDSDLDLLVKFKDKKSLLDLVKLEEDLSRLLGRKVDVQTPQSISGYIMPYVKKDLRVVYEER